MTPNTFEKRTFSLALYLHSLGAAVGHLPVLAVALVRPATSVALREKVMLAVTSVNDCRYCAWVHTGQALANDVDLDELRAILDGGDAADADPAERIAILFAQHFADTGRRPSSEAAARLAAHFSRAQRLELMAYIHAIYFANLSGNTFDALLARLAGRRIVGGDLLTEVLVSVTSAPVLLPIWLRLRPGRARTSAGRFHREAILSR